MAPAISFDEMKNCNGTESSEFPKWLKMVTMENAVQEQLGDFKRILDIKMENGSKQGENYSSLLISVSVEVEMLGKLEFAA